MAVADIRFKQYWKVIAGTLLAVLGAVAIILAWFNTRNLLEVADEVPYLISGGIGGLGMIIGAVWFLRSHETTLLLDHIRETAERVEAMQAELSALKARLDDARVEVELEQLDRRAVRGRAAVRSS